METDTAHRQFSPNASHADESLEQCVAETVAAQAASDSTRWRPADNEQPATVPPPQLWPSPKGVAGNVPEAVAPLRAAGLLIWTDHDGYGTR